LTVLAERGYLILAVNNSNTDYLACAKKLVYSIREWHPNAEICLLTDTQVDDNAYDIVKVLPHGDLGGYINDWQVFAATPFRETIKLEADMFCAGPIDHWWRLFEHRDVVISQGCRDFYDQPSTSRQYRQLFDNNNLPDVYNAITYWRRSHTAKEFFDLVRNIFEQWESYKTLLKFPEETPSTDVVYAMAAVIMGPDRVTLPKGFGPNIVHMKRGMISTSSEDWRDELVWEQTNPGIRINTVAQWGLVHYHVKDLANDDN
jgi:hypothetical protein